MLHALFEYLEPYLPVRALTKFQCLIVTLMKIRLNLSHVDLGHRFGITKSTVSRIFLTVIDIMYTRMKPFNVWPEREQLRKTMPLCFTTYFGKKVVVVVDCFIETMVESFAKGFALSLDSQKNYFFLCF